MTSWQLQVKDFQGHAIPIQVDNPQVGYGILLYPVNTNHCSLYNCWFTQGTSVRRLKDLVHQKDPDIPPFEQRLVHAKKELDDDCLLSSYPEIADGSVIFLVRLIPFQVFVKGMDGSSHTIRIPSKSPLVTTTCINRFALRHGCTDCMHVCRTS